MGQIPTHPLNVKLLCSFPDSDWKNVTAPNAICSRTTPIALAYFSERVWRHR
jgi:hypothetical protein